MKKPFSEIPCLQGGQVTLRRLVREDADALEKLVSSPKVYHYLPTFLFERKYRDVRQVIERLYDECLRESLILGVFNPEGFCGLAEMYGFRDPIHKISVGYRLLESSWGKGIATQALGLMTRYLLEKTDIEIITASTMLENHASARVLEKNGFSLVVHGAPEDWGYPEPTIADKWIL
jgi:ribosomal-protein-alanine N-acetyltransferase